MGKWSISGTPAFLFWIFAMQSVSAQSMVSLLSDDEPVAASQMILTDAVHEEYATLDQLSSLQRQLDELRAIQAASSSVVMAPAVSPKEEKKYPDFTITGFFQLDSAYFAQDDASIATLGTRIQDGTTFRRARLAATGHLTERASYQMEFDFAQTQARFVDVWGQVSDTPLGNLRIGRYRQPFGMTELTSVRELPFLERPTVFALAPFRQTGIMFFDTALDQQMTWAFSGFRTISDNFGNVYGNNGGYGTAERITGLLMDQGDTGLIHTGLAHSFLDPARDVIQYVSQDEIFIGQQAGVGPTGLSVQPVDGVPPFLNTGLMDVDTVNVFNVESAISCGRGLIQSEFRWSNLDLMAGENVTVHGAYVQARYVLTGEIIPYNRTAGVFGRIKPDRPLDVRKGQWGAWEIATRWSHLNLNPLFGKPGVPGPGRELTSTSVALNWYWWTHAKCQLEYVHGQLDDPTLGNSQTSTVASRVQFDF